MPTVVEACSSRFSARVAAAAAVLCGIAYVTSLTSAGTSVAAALALAQRDVALTRDADSQPSPLADGCRHVYIDLGTNVGIQLRKLYSPDDYPLALIKPAFEKYFGTGNRTDVCAFGWEPNPAHANGLVALQAAYRSAGRRITIYNDTAVGVNDGWCTFRSDGDMEHKEWGGRVTLLPVDAERPPGAVRVTGIASWLAANVLARRVPSGPRGGLPAAVVMKIDLEGTDELVFGQLFSSSVLCAAIDYVYFEDQHVRRDVADFMAKSLRASRCRTQLDVLDDETYQPGMLSLTPGPRALDGTV